MCNEPIATNRILHWCLNCLHVFFFVQFRTDFFFLSTKLKLIHSLKALDPNGDFLLQNEDDPQTCLNDSVNNSMEMQQQSLLPQFSLASAVVQQKSVFKYATVFMWGGKPYKTNLQQNLFSVEFSVYFHSCACLVSMDASVIHNGKLLQHGVKD